ncbi:MAG: hypothetical protein K8R90_08395 [Candidatus Cloacimonetes bacterium]|nr:hypothetical protein [Candidatus Cloacimonadota bacterium]
MKFVVLSFLLCSFLALGAVGMEESAPKPEPVVEEPTPEPASAPIPEPVIEEKAVQVEVQVPRHKYSLVINGIKRYSDVPTIARISLRPQITDTHTVQLDAWFEIKVGEEDWYSVPELVELLR